MAVLIVTPYQQFFDSNGDPLNGGKVFTYEAGTTTPKATYTDNTEATPLANPVILDSAGRAVIWGTGSYKFVVTDALDNVIRTVDNVAMYSASSGSVIPSATAAGTVNAFTADYTPNVSLTDKVLVIVNSLGANTVTNPTFAPDGNTARTVVKQGGQALVAGDTGNAGYPMLLQYDLANTRWELLNAATSLPSQTGNADLALVTNGTTTSWSRRFLSPLSNYMYVRDEKTSGTAPATMTAGVNNIRVLNTVVVNTITGASLASNQVTLPAGTYYIIGKAPSLATGVTKARLFNATDSAYVLEGVAGNLFTGNVNSYDSVVRGQFTITSAKAFELRLYTAASNTGGNAASQGTEVYAELEIWRIA